MTEINRNPNLKIIITSIWYICRKNVFNPAVTDFFYKSILRESNSFTYQWKGKKVRKIASSFQFFVDEHGVIGKLRSCSYGSTWVMWVSSTLWNITSKEHRFYFHIHIRHGVFQRDISLYCHSTMSPQLRVGLR